MAPLRPPKSRPLRLAARAIILHEDRLLLVNAYPDHKGDLWCAPGGGVEKHSSLADNLIREVYEECGLTISVDAPCLINEFHDEDSDFHQVDLFFRCSITGGTLDDSWQDPEHVVSKRHFFSRTELEQLSFRPLSLPDVAWGNGVHYDALEPLLKF
ncbi:NUDIX domain-containing protein [Shimia sagamensis]|uniref:ADP-ribose pyrophosphatase YjhB, NUDIX family n=1 Tax=Shimia sagamensis TaxID=1566352 RepID=A0ABY1P4V7_9RHOB|nr:NUDIX hydrolase [Shimia sagamensis]SMP26467.1 ADP-ribose pyrophosphatase YjhB, NUDIX family [Shimia sagamensis]